MFRTREASSLALHEDCPLGVVHVRSPTRDVDCYNSQYTTPYVCVFCYAVGRGTRFPPPERDVDALDGWVVGNALQLVSVSHART